MKGESKKVCIVTGGSSGIGKCTVLSLLGKGCTVYEFSRRDPGSGNIGQHIYCDVTDEETVRNAVSSVLQKEGRIDILVNCAGYGISGAIEFTDLDDAKRQFDVNFFGMVNVCKAVLPVMRRQSSGRIVNISSVAAPVSIPFQAFYSASKAAINSYTLSLANEVRNYGITVTAVQPGDISTGFTSARKKSEKGDKEYGGRIKRSVEKMERDEMGGMKPETAGKYIAKIALKKRIKPLYAIGFSYKAICVLCKILPAGATNKLVYLLYAK
ncbi:MAG: SDR family oxidoreductase [Clostridia bacterium]|nr:SDR family oxidoreductase [Clostridia bacterium]